MVDSPCCEDPLRLSLWKRSRVISPETLTGHLDAKFFYEPRALSPWTTGAEAEAKSTFFQVAAGGVVGEIEGLWGLSASLGGSGVVGELGGFGGCRRAWGGGLAKWRETLTGQFFAVRD